MRDRINRLFLIFICALLNVSCMAQYEEYPALFKCSKKLNGAYGICSHINRLGPRYEFDTRELELSMIDSVGASWIRTDWDWTSLMMDTTDNLKYNHFDTLMSSVQLHHRKVFGIITLRNKFQMNDLNKWSYYVEQTSTHYRNIVDDWEVINEADLITYWHPGIYAKEYVELLKSGSNAIRKGNKKARVLFSGIANTDTKFIDSVFSAGVSNCFDIMNVHRYSPKTIEPEIFLSYFLQLSEKLTRYGIDKPVWLTECGTTSAKGWATEETQANRLPRIFLISFACGIDKVFWYKSRSRELNPKDKEDFFGLWHKDYSPKPAFYAYQTLTKMCPDKSVRPILRRYGNVYIAHWKRPDGKKTYALWTSRERVDVDLILKGNYACYDIYGNKVSLTRHNIEVSPSILYFVGEKKFELGIVD